MMLIIGYCFGIRSERKLCEDVHLKCWDPRQHDALALWCFGCGFRFGLVRSLGLLLLQRKHVVHASFMLPNYLLSSICLAVRNHRPANHMMRKYVAPHDLMKPAGVRLAAGVELNSHTVYARAARTGNQLCSKARRRNFPYCAKLSIA